MATCGLAAVLLCDADAGPRSDAATKCDPATKSLLSRYRELKFASAVNDLVLNTTFVW